MTKKIIAAQLLLASLAISGCSGNSVPGTLQATTTSNARTVSEKSDNDAQLEKNATYGSVVALRNAVEAAGYQCSEWSIRPKAVSAAEMADCDYTTVLMTYATEQDKQANLGYFAQTGGTLLVGPNWIINGKSEMLDEVAPELGGTRWTRSGPTN